MIRDRAQRHGARTETLERFAAGAQELREALPGTADARHSGIRCLSRLPTGRFSAFASDSFAGRVEDIVGDLESQAEVFTVMTDARQLG